MYETYIHIYKFERIFTCKLYFINWGDYILQIFPHGAKSLMYIILGEE